MKDRRLQSQKQGDRIIVGKRPERKRIEELDAKTGKTTAERLEEVNLRLKLIMEHLEMR